MNLVNEYEVLVFGNFDVVFDRFLGDLSEVQNAHNAFSNWKKIRDEVVELSLNNKIEAAVAITRGKGAGHVEFMNSEIQKMIDYAGSKAISFYEESKNKESFIIKIIVYYILGIMIICISISVIITKSIVFPLNRIVIIFIIWHLGIFKKKYTVKQMMK